MMSVNEDMMIMNRVGQEILRHFGCRFDPYLRTAEVGLELATLEFYIHSQQTLQVTAHLHQRIIARWQVSVDSYTYT